jgi:hypothetical protein
MRLDRLGSSRLTGLALAVCASTLLAACETFAPPSTPAMTNLASGIHGIVLLGPTCDSPTAADPCLEPYSARLVVSDLDGRVVGDVTSGSDGTFALSLGPGDYIIQPAPGGDPFPRARAQSVTVLDGETTEVEIDYEIGGRADAAG